MKERVRRANQKTCRFGHPTTDTILISIHVNAAGSDGQWHTATGWSAYTFPGHTESDRLADCLYHRAAEKYLPGRKLRTDFSDGDPDLEEPFYILKHTLIPAVLTENLFMDNRQDCAFLLSDAGRRAIIALHVAGIIAYLNAKEPEGFR